MTYLHPCRCDILVYHSVNGDRAAKKESGGGEREEEKEEGGGGLCLCWKEEEEEDGEGRVVEEGGRGERVVADISLLSTKDERMNKVYERITEKIFV